MYNSEACVYSHPLNKTYSDCYREVTRSYSIQILGLGVCVCVCVCVNGALVAHCKVEVV